MAQSLDYSPPRRRRHLGLILLALAALVAGPTLTYHNVEWLIAANERLKQVPSERAAEQLKSWYVPSMRLFRAGMWVAATGGIVLAAAAAAFLVRSRLTWALVLAATTFQAAIVVIRIAEIPATYVQSTEPLTRERGVEMLLRTSERVPEAMAYVLLVILLMTARLRGLVRQYVVGVEEASTA
jgi:hypothetical protein